MTLEEAAARLDRSMNRDAAGRYCFCCKKAFVLLKLYGNANRLRFTARQKLVFRADQSWLTVEHGDTGTVQRRFAWENIECLAAGEPEVDNGPLFQG